MKIILIIQHLFNIFVVAGIALKLLLSIRQDHLIAISIRQDHLIASSIRQDHLIAISIRQDVKS